MKTKSYSSKLEDPRWKIKRDEILRRDNHRCQICGNNEGILHVHHKYYVNLKEPYEYPNDALITLCERCHNDEHNTLEKKLQERLGEVTNDYIFSLTKEMLLYSPGFIFEFGELGEWAKREILYEMYDLIQRKLVDKYNYRRKQDFIHDKEIEETPF